MDKEKNFGKALKQLRESKNIDLEQISSFTKVSINDLNNLEAGNFSFTSMIYIKLFLREYVKYIDQQQVDQIMNQFDQMNDSELRGSSSKKSKANLTFLPTDSEEDIGLDLENNIDNNNLISDNNYFTPKKIASIILSIIVIYCLLQLVIVLSGSNS